MGLNFRLRRNTNGERKKREIRKVSPAGKPCKMQRDGRG